MCIVPVKQFLPIAILVFVCLSCTKSKQDPSLTVDEYIKLGVPDPRKKWDMDDFHMVYSILGKLKWDKPYQLPAKDSKKSGLLFERMLSMDNASFLQDSALSLNEKAERISAFVKAYDILMDVYSHPVIKAYYHREYLDLQIFNLRLAEAMMNLAHKIYESDDPTVAGLKYAYGSIKRDYLTGLTNDLKVQRNTSKYLKKDLDRMADSIYASVMRNKELMDSSAVTNLKQSLQVVLDSTSSDYIRDKYTILKESI